MASVLADSQHGSPMASLMAYSHHGAYRLQPSWLPYSDQGQHRPTASVLADSQHGSPMASLMAYSHRGYPIVIKVSTGRRPVCLLTASMAHLWPA